jgi:DNA-binding transcriptional LysR family regulator
MDAIAVFVKVVESGSFSTAAKRLGMPKTTVSAKVAGLEKRLGARLI